MPRLRPTVGCPTVGTGCLVGSAAMVATYRSRRPEVRRGSSLGELSFAGSAGRTTAGGLIYRLRIIQETMKPFGNYAASHDQICIEPGYRLDHLRDQQGFRTAFIFTELIERRPARTSDKAVFRQHERDRDHRHPNRTHHAPPGNGSG